MTAKELLTRITHGQLPIGRPDRGEWKWSFEGESVTRAVNALRKNGKVNVVYHHKFASISAA